MKKKSKTNCIHNTNKVSVSEQGESSIIDTISEKVKDEKSLKKKIDLIKQANISAELKTRLVATCIVTHETKPILTMDCDKYKKCLHHCIPPCARIVLPQEIMNDPRKAAICTIHINFDNVKFNKPGEGLEKEERLSVWSSECDSGFEDRLEYYNNYSRDTFKEFVSDMEKKIIQDVQSFVITLPNADGDSKAKVINGITQQQVLFREIRNALSQNNLEYMGELMFYTGRLFERINNVFPYATYTVEGAAGRKSHKSGATKRNKKQIDSWPKVIEEWRKIKTQDIKTSAKYLEIAEIVYGPELKIKIKNKEKEFTEKQKKMYLHKKDEVIFQKMLQNMRVRVYNILKRKGEIGDKIN